MVNEGLLIDLGTSSSSAITTQNGNFDISYPNTSTIGYLQNVDKSGNTIYTNPSIEGNFYKRGVDSPFSLRSKHSAIVDVDPDMALSPKEKQKRHKIARRTWSDKIKAMYRDYLSASPFSMDPLTTETSNYTPFHQSAAADSSPGYAGCFSMSPNFKGPSGGDGGLLQVLGLNSPSETSPISSPMLKSSIVDECLSPLQNLELFCNRLKSTSCDDSISSHSYPDSTRDTTESLDDVDNDDDKSDDTDTLGNFLSRMKQIPIPRYTNSTATLIQLTDSGTKSGEVKYLPTCCTTAAKNRTAAEVTAMELESMKAWTANLERKFNDMDTFEIKLKDRIDEVPSPLMPVSANLSTERKTGSAKTEAKEPNDEISLASKLLKNGPLPERSRKAITWIKLKKERTSRKVWLGPGNECTKSFEKGIKRIGLMMKLNSKKKSP